MIRTEVPVSAAVGTDYHRPRTGDVNGRGGSYSQFSPSYAGHIRSQRRRAPYSKPSFASNWFGDSSTRCFRKGRSLCPWTLAANTVTDQFWRRWSREYLPTLLPRQKWTTKRSIIQHGNVVLIAGDAHLKNNWQMRRVCRVFRDSRNIVRTS